MSGPHYRPWLGGERSYGRAPILEVMDLERLDTNREIRSAVRYIKSDNYLAVAFGVDEERVNRLRKEVESHPGRPVPSYEPFGNEGDGALATRKFRSSTAMASANLHKRIMRLYDQRAQRDGTTLNEAAFAMGMRP